MLLRLLISSSFGNHMLTKRPEGDPRVYDNTGLWGHKSPVPVACFILLDSQALVRNVLHNTGGSSTFVS